MNADADRGVGRWHAVFAAGAFTDLRAADQRGGGPVDIGEGGVGLLETDAVLGGAQADDLAALELTRNELAIVPRIAGERPALRDAKADGIRPDQGDLD